MGHPGIGYEASVVVVALGVIGGRGNATSSAGPVGVEEFASRLVDTFIGVRTKEVSLRLQ